MSLPKTRAFASRVLSLTALAAALACKNEEPAPAPRTTPSSLEAKPAPAPSAAASRTKEALYLPGRFPIATGPRLGIQPGLGLGPIRFGATVKTVERLMDLPCDYRTEKACRYVSRAVEFYLDGGVVNEIRIHRLERPAEPNPRVYGVFNGMFPGGARFGMYREAVIETLGKPTKVETVSAPNEAGTVEVHHYDDMRLEYDRIENGNVVLGGVVLLKPRGK